MITYKEAYEIFKKKFPNTKATEVFDFGDCFCISDAVSGDMVDADYSIDKHTGKIEELSFFEFTEKIKAVGEAEIKSYIV